MAEYRFQHATEYRFQHVTVQTFPDVAEDFPETYSAYILTKFDDGKFCFALPSFDEEAFARARSLGYRDSAAGVWLMHVEHELCHTALAEAQGLRWSPCLRSHIDGPPENGLREEAVVFLLQRAMNEGRAVLPSSLPSPLPRRRIAVASSASGPWVTVPGPKREADRD